jgi:hypothetical protein
MVCLFLEMWTFDQDVEIFFPTMAVVVLGLRYYSVLSLYMKTLFPWAATCVPTSATMLNAKPFQDFAGFHSLDN